MTDRTERQGRVPRVLFNMPSQPTSPSGVGRLGLELLRHLVRSNRFAYDFRGQFSREQLLERGIEGLERVTTIPPVRGYLTETIKSTLVAPVRFPASRYDLVVNVDPLGTAAGGRKRLTILHDLYFKALPQLFTPKQRLRSEIVFGLTLSRSDSIVCDSKATEEDARKFFPRLDGRLSTIYPDSTTTAAPGDAPPPGLEPESYVLAVSNAGVNKNFGALADAFVQIAAERPWLRLVHVGADPHGIFATRLSEAGLADRLVRRTGISDAELATLYRFALCLCVPSLYEGFGLPLIEAQRLECCTVYSDRSSTGEVGGGGGIAFDPENVTELAGILARLADDPLLRKTLRAAGLRNAERFSWQRAAEQYEAEFERLVGA
ncbi:glycosyltransferase family 4 protein [Sphingosinithalassobacter sp. LHW66-3]|uniref:glycosyltransferase family 4 protein n=1 Tax=Sphingosinithalassobacter sp. LHW66-3 TaxID=3424718 RepID=UPI003D6BAF07